MPNNFLNLISYAPLLGLLPEILLVIAIFVALFLSHKPKLKQIILLFILFLSFGFCVYTTYAFSVTASFPLQLLSFYGFEETYVFDQFSFLFKSFILFLLILLLANSRFIKPLYSFFFLAATLASLMMVSCHNFILLFVSAEMLALCSVVMIAYNREEKLSGEAAIKYLTGSAIAVGFYLLAVSILYGIGFSEPLGSQVNSMSFSVIVNFRNNLSLFDNMIFSFPFILFNLVTLGLIVFFSFKLSLFPFHSWTPDTFEGSNFSLAAFLSSISKIAVLAVFLRLSWEIFPLTAELFGKIYSNTLLPDSWWRYLFGDSPFAFSPMSIYFLILALLAICSMWYGNIMGFKQVKKENGSFKRLLAYSSIAQTGYIIAVLCFVIPSSGNDLNIMFGLKQAVYFTLIYSLLNIGAFIGLIQYERFVKSWKNSTKSINIDLICNIKGLFKYKPVLSIFLAICFAGLAGVLPFMLITKIMILDISFTGALGNSVFVSSKLICWFISLSILFSSVIGVIYYFQIVRKMFASDNKYSFDFEEHSWKFNKAFKISTVVILLSLMSISFNPNFWFEKVSSTAVYSLLSMFKNEAINKKSVLDSELQQIN